MKYWLCLSGHVEMPTFWRSWVTFSQPIRRERMISSMATAVIQWEEGSPRPLRGRDWVTLSAARVGLAGDYISWCPLPWSSSLSSSPSSCRSLQVVKRVSDSDNSPNIIIIVISSSLGVIVAFDLSCPVSVSFLNFYHTNIRTSDI